MIFTPSFVMMFIYLDSLSALIENKVFSVHGGLSPAISNLDQVKTEYLFFFFFCGFYVTKM